MASDGENNPPVHGEGAGNAEDVPASTPAPAEDTPENGVTVGLPIAINARLINPEDQMPGGELYQSAAKSNYILIQFTERPDERQVAELDALHVKFCSKIPPTTWLARYEPQDLAPLLSLPYVVYANPYHESLSIAPAFEDELRPRAARGIRGPGIADATSSSTPSSQLFDVFIMLHPYARTPSEIREELVSSYGIPREAVYIEVSSLQASLTADQILRVSKIDDVSGVHRTPELQFGSHLLHNVIRTRDAVAKAHEAKDFDLDGTGEIIVVCDSGFDNGKTTGSDTHPFFGDRVIYRDNRAGKGREKCEDFLGHGTHVAGIALGSYDGMTPNDSMPELWSNWLIGVAPKASLIVQNVCGMPVHEKGILKSPGANIFTPSEMKTDFAWQRIYMDPYYNYPKNYYPAKAPAILPQPDDTRQINPVPPRAARIHNCSSYQSVTDPSGYEPYGKMVDQVVRELPDYVLVVCAGNDGDSNALLEAQEKRGVKSGIDKVIYGQIAGWSAAKNVITVGACYNDNQWIQTVPTPAPHDPKLKLNVYDIWLPQAKGGTQISAVNIPRFSSRGPPTDRLGVPASGKPRIKPDVVAPGVTIYSAKSRDQIEVLPNYPMYRKGKPDPDPSGSNRKELCQFRSGTSQAAPVVSGAAALLRQALATPAGRGFANPSAALIKALIVHGAVDLSEGTTPGKLWQGNAEKAGSVINIGPAPNNIQGWGRLDLAASIQTVLDTKKSAMWDVIPGFAPSSPRQDAYSVKIDLLAESNVPNTPQIANIKATLVWSDSPGFDLQNQLALGIWFEDDVHGGRSVGVHDTPMEFNNVQKLEVRGLNINKTLSAWVTVTKVEITTPPQPYALIWTVWYD